MIKGIYKKLVKEKTRILLRNFANRVLGLYYFGNTFTCNCCKKNFKKFLPKGNVKRLNAQCPYCGSLERNRLLLFYLENETLIFKQYSSLLHIAPEQCLSTIFKKSDLEYIDGDINAALARNVVDITQIQYPNDYFDFIICSHVLGHIPDERKAIQELKRVAKPDGMVLIMTLLDTNSELTFEDSDLTTNEERLRYYGEEDLCRLHGLDFAKRIEREGFKVSQIDYRIQLGSEVSKKFSLGDGKREIIFNCTK